MKYNVNDTTAFASIPQTTGGVKKKKRKPLEVAPAIPKRARDTTAFIEEPVLAAPHPAISGYHPVLPGTEKQKIEAAIEGPIDRSLRNLILAHHEVFGDWPTFSLTADIINSGEVKFDSYDDALMMFRAVKDSMGGGGAEWMLNAGQPAPNQEQTIQGMSKRASGYLGFGEESDILDPEMIASFKPKSVEDFLFGPYRKGENRDEMVRPNEIRLDEMLIALPKQWYKTNIAQAYKSTFAARSTNNTELDADKSLMVELNKYLAERMPDEYKPAPTARWQPKTEAALRMLQMYRAASVFMAHGGEGEESEEARSFLVANGFKDITTTIDEMIRLTPDPTGETDAQKRQMITDWYVISRGPHQTERQAIHELYDLNADALTIEAQKSVGADHMKGIAGFIVGAARKTGQAVEDIPVIGDIVESDEFDAMTRAMAPFAGEIYDHFVSKGVDVLGYVATPFIKAYETWSKYTTSLMVATAESEGIVPSAAKAGLLVGGAALTLTGVSAPVGIPMMVESGLMTNVEDWKRGGPIGDFLSNIWDISDGDVEWFGSWWENYKKAEEGYEANPAGYWGGEIMRDLGMEPEAHPEIAFMFTFGAETIRDVAIWRTAKPFFRMAGEVGGAAPVYEEGVKVADSVLSYWQRAKTLGDSPFVRMTMGGAVTAMVKKNPELAAARIAKVFHIESDIAKKIVKAVKPHAGNRSKSMKVMLDVIDELGVGKPRKGRTYLKEAETSAWKGGHRLDPYHWKLAPIIGDALVYSKAGLNHPMMALFTQQMRKADIGMTREYLLEQAEATDFQWRRIINQLLRQRDARYRAKLATFRESGTDVAPDLKNPLLEELELFTEHMATEEGGRFTLDAKQLLDLAGDDINNLPDVMASLIHNAPENCFNSNNLHFYLGAAEREMAEFNFRLKVMKWINLTTARLMRSTPAPMKWQQRVRRLQKLADRGMGWGRYSTERVAQWEIDGAKHGLSDNQLSMAYMYESYKYGRSSRATRSEMSQPLDVKDAIAEHIGDIPDQVHLFLPSQATHRRGRGHETSMAIDQDLVYEMTRVYEQETTITRTLLEKMGWTEHAPGEWRPPKTEAELRAAEGLEGAAGESALERSIKAAEKWTEATEKKVVGKKRLSRKMSRAQRRSREKEMQLEVNAIQRNIEDIKASAGRVLQSNADHLQRITLRDQLMERMAIMRVEEEEQLAASKVIARQDNLEEIQRLSNAISTAQQRLRVVLLILQRSGAERLESVNIAELEPDEVIDLARQVIPANEYELGSYFDVFPNENFDRVLHDTLLSSVEFRNMSTSLTHEDFMNIIHYSITKDFGPEGEAAEDLIMALEDKLGLASWATDETKIGNLPGTIDDVKGPGELAARKTSSEAEAEAVTVPEGPQYEVTIKWQDGREPITVDSTNIGEQLGFFADDTFRPSYDIGARYTEQLSGDAAYFSTEAGREELYQLLANERRAWAREWMWNYMRHNLDEVDDNMPEFERLSQIRDDNQQLRELGIEITDETTGETVSLADLYGISEVKVRLRLDGDIATFDGIPPRVDLIPPDDDGSVLVKEMIDCLEADGLVGETADGVRVVRAVGSRVPAEELSAVPTSVAQNNNLAVTVAEALLNSPHWNDNIRRRAQFIFNQSLKNKVATFVVNRPSAVRIGMRRDNRQMRTMFEHVVEQINTELGKLEQTSARARVRKVSDLRQVAVEGITPNVTVRTAFIDTLPQSPGRVINVGRATKKSGGEYEHLGNPYHPFGKGEFRETETELQVEKYTAYLDKGIAAGKGDPVYDEFMQLVDRIEQEGLDQVTLMCPGKRHTPCHAPVLRQRVEEELLRREGKVTRPEVIEQNRLYNRLRREIRDLEQERDDVEVEIGEAIDELGAAEIPDWEMDLRQMIIDEGGINDPLYQGGLSGPELNSAFAGTWRKDGLRVDDLLQRIKLDLEEEKPVWSGAGKQFDTDNDLIDWLDDLGRRMGARRKPTGKRKLDKLIKERQQRLRTIERDLENKKKKLPQRAQPAAPRPVAAEAVVAEQKVGGVKLTAKTIFAAKDQRKADRATKFIGRGGPKSSTSQYARDFGDRANTGSYTADDVVFISVEGARKPRVEFDANEVNKALDARATILTDIPADRARPHNVGERNLAKYLTKKGYVEEQPGVWRPKSAVPQEKPINIFYTAGHAKELSNFTVRPFTHDGRKYYSVEHAWQTLKTGTFDEKVYNNPGWAKSGRPPARGPKTRPANEELHEQLIRESFEQNPAAKKALLDTGNAPLTHHNPRYPDDPYWSEAFPRLLMKVRSDLAKEAAPAAAKPAAALPEVAPELPKGVKLKLVAGGKRITVPSEAQYTANRASLVGREGSPSPGFVTTIDSEKRAAVAKEVADDYDNVLVEHGRQDVFITDRAGNVIARGYTRIVYGEAGPYIEVHPDEFAMGSVAPSSVAPGTKRKTGDLWTYNPQTKKWESDWNPADLTDPERRYADIGYTAHGNETERVKVYYQVSPVTGMKRPPKYLNQGRVRPRPEGYADYEPGMYYIQLYDSKGVPVVQVHPRAAENLSPDQLLARDIQRTRDRLNQIASRRAIPGHPHVYSTKLKNPRSEWEVELEPGKIDERFEPPPPIPYGGVRQVPVPRKPIATRHGLPERRQRSDRRRKYYRYTFADEEGVTFEKVFTFSEGTKEGEQGRIVEAWLKTEGGQYKTAKRTYKGSRIVSRQEIARPGRKRSAKTERRKAERRARIEGYSLVEGEFVPSPGAPRTTMREGAEKSQWSSVSDEMRYERDDLPSGTDAEAVLLGFQAEEGVLAINRKINEELEEEINWLVQRLSRLRAKEGTPAAPGEVRDPFWEMSPEVVSGVPGGMTFRQAVIDLAERFHIPERDASLALAKAAEEHGFDPTKPLSFVGAHKTRAHAAIERQVKLAKQSIVRVEKEIAEAEEQLIRVRLELEERRRRLAVHLANIENGTVEITEEQLEEFRKTASLVIDDLDPTISADKLAGTLRDKIDRLYNELEQVMRAPDDSMAKYLRKRKGIDVEKDSDIAVPAMDWQLQQWFRFKYDPHMLSMFLGGRMTRFMENVNSYKMFGLVSADEFTNFYKSLIMLRISTMLRIPLADEATRLVALGINPRRAWKMSRQLIRQDKMPGDRVSAISTIFKMATDNEVQVAFGQKGFRTAYYNFTRNSRRSSEYLWWLFGKKLGEKEGRLETAVNKWLASKRAAHKGNEALTQAIKDILEEEGNYQKAWMMIGAERGGPLHNTAFHTFRVSKIDGQITRELYSGERSWVDALEHTFGYFHDHKVFGKHWRLADDLDESLAKQIQATIDKPNYKRFIDLVAFGGEDNMGAAFGRIRVTGLKQTDYHKLQRAIDAAASATEKEELMPMVVARAKSTIDGDIPVFSRVRDAVFSVLDKVGKSLNEVVYTASFEDELKMLRRLRDEKRPYWADKTDLDLEKAAHFQARKFTDQMMFNNSIYFGEDMMRNIFMFLPAYRQFAQFWLPRIITNPVIGSAVYRANRDREQLGFQQIPGTDVQINIGQASFLVNQGDGSVSGWLPSAAPIFTFPISYMGTRHAGEESAWGELSKNWPFEFATPFRALNSPLDKIVYGITGRRLPWPLGTDPTKDPWREMQALRKDALEGKWPKEEESYNFSNRMKMLMEGGWNFFVPWSLRISDREVEKMVMARKDYASATSAAEVQEILDRPENVVFKKFITWQNLPSWDQLRYIKQNPEIIPFMVSGYENPNIGADGRVGWLWSEMRKIGIANPAYYVNRLEQRLDAFERVLSAEEARKTRDAEVAWWDRFQAKNPDLHELERLKNEWENSTGAFAPGGYFNQQGKYGYKYYADLINTKYAGISDTFTGISSYDSDAFKFAEFMDNAGGASRLLLQSSPNYEMYVYQKITKQKDAVKDLAEGFITTRESTQLTREQIKAAGYSDKETAQIYKAIRFVDNIWNKTNKQVAKLGKYGYATSKGRELRKKAIIVQNEMIRSNPLMEKFLGDGPVSLLRSTYLTKPAYLRNDYIMLDEMDEAERNAFYTLVERGKQGLPGGYKGPYLPEEEARELPSGTIIGWQPVMKDGFVKEWKAKVKMGSVVGLVTMDKNPREAKQIEVGLQEGIRLMTSSFERAGSSVAANKAWRAKIKKLPKWAQNLVFDYVRAEGWRYWLDFAGLQRRRIRETINTYYSDTPGFSLQSKYGMQLKRDLAKYASIISKISPEFAAEWRKYNGNNELLNATLSWYL